MEWRRVWVSGERGGVEDEDDVRRRVRAREEVEETSGCLPRVSDESAWSSVTSIEIDDITKGAPFES